MTDKLITGIHHITALASDPQQNLDFYAGILGLRLVKKTINFDAPDVYHLYYGNEVGSPGTILTFFPYRGLPKGRKGNGQLTTTSFSIPKEAFEYWLNRLRKFNIPYKLPDPNFEDELIISFEDGDGLELELVANSRDERSAFTYGHIPREFSIKGIYGITLSEYGNEKTAELLTSHLCHFLTKEKGNQVRYSTNKTPGTFVNIHSNPATARGLSGSGSVHHVAFATENLTTQLLIREKLVKSHYDITQVLDRQYFHSIYFREPGGVLFEVATYPPGFTVDEEVNHLGEELKLPPWQETNRDLIEKALIPIKLDLQRFTD